MYPSTNKRLSELNEGDSAIIAKIMGHGSFRHRITEMGFVKGKIVKVIKRAPLQDPIEYEIMGYKVSLRKSEASLIEVISVNDVTNLEEPPHPNTLIEEQINAALKAKGNHINVALVGNPNSGKTTLFNYASGSHERVGNYSGVTVDAKEASIERNGYVLNITDLPGTYSITEYTPEELYVRMHIIEKNPDIIINVVDASNIERNLFLTTQLIDMNIRVVMALNMYDELKNKNIDLDYKALGKMIGIPIIPTTAVKGEGVEELINKVIEVFEEKDPIVKHIHINYGQNIEEPITKLQAKIRKNPSITDRFSTRFLSIKLLEGDKTTLNLLKDCPNYEEIKRLSEEEIKELEAEYGDKSETVITNAKYGFIAGALKETCVKNETNIEEPHKKDIDDILTHKIWGYPIFLFFMWLMFQTTFTLGNYPMEWIESGVSLLSDFLGKIIPEGAIHDLIIDGIIGGVGGVIVFLPNILILFLFISFMEDSGYMARVAFIMDKFMHKIGLHGKSFIPLLMGFGCNVPAIMATRTLENKKDRLLTMLIIPFMSCSARLPLYVLIISAFFTKHQGLILFSVYIIGIIVAILMAILLKSTVFAKQDAPFVMELPPYRMPTAKNTLKHMWHKGSQYLKKMGTVILLASIIIWVLGYFPRNVNYSSNFDERIAAIEASTTIPAEEKESQIYALELEKIAEHQEQSYIGQIGHFIEPVIQPLGFDWKIGISLITGLAAKEIVVSSMGILYQADLDADENSSSLVEKLQQQVHTSGKLIGQKVFTPLVAYGFMLFVLIYFPCIASIAAIRKEANGKWALFTMIYTTTLAWIVSFAVYNIGSLFC